MTWDMTTLPFLLVKILQAAGTAASLKMEALDELKAGITDEDAAVRYWSVMGILMRGSQAVDAARQQLADARFDSSPSVQVAVQWTLAKHGNDAERERALMALVGLANWDANDVFTVMSALNAIGDLGDKAKPIAEHVTALPSKGEAPNPRYGGYVARLLADLNGTTPPVEEEAKALAKKKKKKGRE